MTRPVILRLAWLAAGAALCLTTPAAAQQQTGEATTTAADASLSVAPSAELGRVQNLVRANALGLAQAILEQRAPAIGDASAPNDNWELWERQLWELYRGRGEWQKLLLRVRGLPPGLPRRLQDDARLLEVAALTALGRGADARQVIRGAVREGVNSPAGLAATPEKTPGPSLSRGGSLRNLRQALIANYLADDMLADADAAMTTFRRDYGADEGDWLLLAAGVLLRMGQTDAAVNLLAPAAGPAARLMRLYARLTNESLTADEVMMRATEMLQQPRNAPFTREILAVLVQAAAAADAPQTLTDALERYLQNATAQHEPGLRRIYPRFTADDLLDAYSHLATTHAEEADVPINSHLALLQLAEETDETEIARRAIFAHLTAVAVEEEVRRAAMDGYANALVAAERTPLIHSLFGDDARLGKLILSDEAGLALSAYALEIGDFALAAEANANLQALPEDVARIDWLLQSARIEIFAGRHARGEAKLHEWIAEFDEFTPEQADAVLQGIFDLQTVRRHSQAIALLREVESRAPNAKYRREIAFWSAESHQGLGEYAVAADLFLHSALQQGGGFDRWGQAARYRAAEAMMEGGLFEDARRLFEDLLARSESEGSRAALKQKLQQLRLLESAGATP